MNELEKKSKLYCPKELNFTVECKNKRCSINEMKECWQPILDKQNQINYSDKHFGEDKFEF